MLNFLDSKYSDGPSLMFEEWLSIWNIEFAFLESSYSVTSLICDPASIWGSSFSKYRKS